IRTANAFGPATSFSVAIHSFGGDGPPRHGALPVAQETELAPAFAQPRSRKRIELALAPGHDHRIGGRDGYSQVGRRFLVPERSAGSRHRLWRAAALGRWPQRCRYYPDGV